MSLLNSLPWRKTPTPTPLRDQGSAIGAPTEDGPQGCGWFDSSHELQRGLWVQEHDSADELAQELPLASWLELHLAAWRPAAQSLS
jgi:hypothetical protein